MVNIKQLESRAATLGAHVIYSTDLSPGTAAAIKKGHTWYIVMRDQDHGLCKELALAHELAHIILGHKGNVLVDGEDRAQEDEAWCLAWRLIDD